MEDNASVNLKASVSTLFNNTSSNLGSGSLSVGSTYGHNDLVYRPYYDYYANCYHTYIKQDKFETAFKLARKLMDKKIVRPQKTVEDFFKLMDAIIEVL